MANDIENWEDDGGARVVPRAAPLSTLPSSLLGSPSQVEWAERIKTLVGEEFDRVERSFRSVAARQNGSQRADTETILSILEEQRAAVMRREQAGYFIHDWQEIDDQVRKMIGQDARFQAIKSNRKKLSEARV
jgi:hypothetical protein